MSDAVLLEKLDSLAAGARPWNGWRVIAKMAARRLREYAAYADTLADGLPEGMLPKDVVLLRETNARMDDENVRLKYGVEWLRKVIHACNRNPIPNSQRMRWREICDDILEGKHVNPDDPNFTEGR